MVWFVLCLVCGCVVLVVFCFVVVVVGLVCVFSLVFIILCGAFVELLWLNTSLQ